MPKFNKYINQLEFTVIRTHIVTSCRLNSYHYSPLSYSVWLYLAGVGLKCHMLYRCEGVSWPI